MILERLPGKSSNPPFPVYDHLVQDLLAAHARDRAGRDATVARVLCTAAGYAYADIATLATMMSRLGLEESACVRLSQTVEMARESWC
ncbi:MAG: hypothetical protein U0163_18810 [Gemmatimonadaceae bacterium]